MHARLLVTCDKNKAKTSEEARKYVYDQLINDVSFIGAYGRFYISVCDWFVIGGRWSGELTTFLLPKEKLEQAIREFGNKYHWYASTDPNSIEQDPQYIECKSIFRRYFPDFKGLVPRLRNPYAELGYEDDAMVVTESVYKACLKEYEGETEFDVKGLYTFVFADLERDLVSPQFVGTKWIVVVDYHM